MLTWPDVRTLYTGVYGEDSYNINHHSNFNFSARFGFQNETIESEFGYNSLKIFYPDMSDTQSRFIFNLASQYTHHVQKFQFLAGIGYGERAPSVTESYGFYLYNSFDNYDYIGNPYLTNEQSFELDGGVEFSTKKLKLGVDASYFHIKNYIIGEIDPDIDRMTIGAEGVKVYEALKYATIFDAGFNANYAISKLFSVNGNVNYNLGIDNNGNNLPLISPVDYSFQMYFNKSHFNASFGLTGNGEQRNYSPTYGEDATQAYTLFDASASYNFYKGNNSLFVKLGIDNIFDRYYSSYSNWNNIPSMGRNCYINMILTIN
jgi:iron complex outermembrane receptor protein